MPIISFCKYSGCGNDFILIDNRTYRFFPSSRAIASLCHRQQGIGADGIVFLEHPTSIRANYRMRIFNADGSEAEMCGNGLRCLANFIRSKEKTSNNFMIQTMHQFLAVSFDNDLVQVSMPRPSPLSSHRLSIGQQSFHLHFLDTGVPHTVLFVDNLEDPHLFSLAPDIRFHRTFQPKGTNVNFAKLLPNNTIAVRTYERGVEQETLACGTGAVAVAMAAAQIHHLPSPMTVKTKSRDILTIAFEGPSSAPTHLTMTGPAIKTFEGSFIPNVIQKLAFGIDKNCLDFRTLI